jgi:hypothetical protein
LSGVAVVFHFCDGKVIVVVLLLDFFAEIVCVISSVLGGGLEPRQNLLPQVKAAPPQVMAVPTRVMAATSRVMAAPTLPLLRTVEHSRPFRNELSFKMLEMFYKWINVKKFGNCLMITKTNIFPASIDTQKTHDYIRRSQKEQTKNSAITADEISWNGITCKVYYTFKQCL